MSSLIIVIFVMAVCAVADMKGIKPLIVGGTRASIEEAPFMAIYLTEMQKYRNVCGASILSEKFLLSAAHCYNSTERYYVLVGSATFDNGQRYNIEKTLIHPKYNYITIDYDILVIKLRGKLVYSSSVQPIKMADSKLVIEEGAILDTFGFGVTEHGRLSKYLRKVRVPYVYRDKCSVLYNSYLTDRMICAGQEGKDSCGGDSGGPLVYGNILVGVVSFGTDCGHPNFPGVYASVSSVRNFIDNAINKM